MRRLAVVGAALAIALAVGLFLGLRGGGGDKTVAHVGGKPIAKSQLEAVVAHFRPGCRCGTRARHRSSGE